MKQESVAMERNQIFTIGHSNQSCEAFLEMLTKHDIQVVVDVRSSPFSKFSTQFNQANLLSAVVNAGRKYLYLGQELGGMPKDKSFYDDDGHILYGKIAETLPFQQGIERLLKGIASYRVALLCGEEDPSNCHRRRLIGRVLQGRGVTVNHIRNGYVQTEEELARLTEAQATQLSLFSKELR